MNSPRKATQVVDHIEGAGTRIDAMIGLASKYQDVDRELSIDLLSSVEEDIKEFLSEGGDEREHLFHEAARVYAEMEIYQSVLQLLKEIESEEETSSSLEGSFAGIEISGPEADFEIPEDVEDSYSEERKQLAAKSAIFLLNHGRIKEAMSLLERYETDDENFISNLIVSESHTAESQSLLKLSKYIESPLGRVAAISRAAGKRAENGNTEGARELIEKAFRIAEAMSDRPLADGAFTIIAQYLAVIEVEKSQTAS